MNYDLSLGLVLGIVTDLVTINLVVVFGLKRTIAKLQETTTAFIRSTDYDFRSLKTRLADEERVNQRELARERYAKQKGVRS